MADVTAPQFQQDVNNAADWANGDENTTVTMRLGQQADSPAKTIKDIKDAGSEAAGSIQFTVKGTFSDGFTIDYYFELGETATGEIYRYKRPNALPFVVPAGFDPAVDGRFEQWVNTDHNNLTNRNAVGAHDASSIETLNFNNSDAQEAINNIVSLAGYSEVGNFTDGFTFTSESDVGYFSGRLYKFSGSGNFPVVVSPGADPLSTDYTDVSGGVYSFADTNRSGALKGKYNIKNNNPFSSIRSDLHTCWIGYGGHESFPNTIGSVDGTGANYSGVMGYDNTTDALATVMWHFHGTIETAADHPTMLGGSFCRIQGGSYCVTLGGTNNNIVGGNYTLILGGRDNTINPASGAVIVGGNGNINGGAHSIASGLSVLIGTSGDRSVGFGGGHTITNVGTGALSGVGHTVSGQYSHSTGGRDCDVLGSYSRGGGYEAKTQYGADSWSSGGFSGAKGSAQITDIVTRIQTSNETESNQFVDGVSVKPVIPESTTWALKTQCVATDGTDHAVFEFNALIYRGAGNTAVTPNSGDSPTIVHQTSGATTWSHRVTVSTNGGVNIKATGEAGKNIRWTTRLTITEVAQ